MCSALMNSMTMPNDMKRRRRPRSLMTRDSNWPDSHDLWKPIGRRCNWSKRSRRMLVSMCEVARDMIQRRISEMIASAEPTSRMRKENHSTPRRSRSRMGPSTIWPSSTGMVTLASTPSGLIAKDTANCFQNGLM